MFRIRNQDRRSDVIMFTRAGVASVSVSPVLHILVCKSLSYDPREVGECQPDFEDARAQRWFSPKAVEVPMYMQTFAHPSQEQ